MKDIELKPFDKVLVRDKNTDVWRADFFEKYEDPRTKFPMRVVSLFEDGTVYLFIQGVTLLNMGYLA